MGNDDDAASQSRGLPGSGGGAPGTGGNSNDGVKSGPKTDALDRMAQLVREEYLKPNEVLEFTYRTHVFPAYVREDGVIVFQAEAENAILLDTPMDEEEFRSPTSFVNSVARRFNQRHRVRFRGRVNMSGWELVRTQDGRSLGDLKNQMMEDLKQISSGGAAGGKRKRSLVGVATGASSTELGRADQADNASGAGEGSGRGSVSKRGRIEEATDEQDRSADNGLDRFLDEEFQSRRPATRQRGARRSDTSGRSATKSGAAADFSKAISKDDRAARRSRRRRGEESKDNALSEADSDLDSIPMDEEEDVFDKNPAATKDTEQKASESASKSKSGREASGSDELIQSDSDSARILKLLYEVRGASSHENEGTAADDDDEDDGMTDGSRSAWTLEEQELMLKAMREDRTIGVKRLSQGRVLKESGMVTRRGEDCVGKFMSDLMDRMKSVDMASNSSVAEVTSFLAAEVAYLRRRESRLIQREEKKNGKDEAGAGAESDRGMHSLKSSEREKKQKLESDKVRKKHKREVDDLKSRLESEMATRRDVELEKNIIEIQLKEARRNTEREAKARQILDEECEQLKLKELEARRRLDRARSKLAALRGELICETVDQIELNAVETDGTDSPVDFSKRAQANPEPGARLVEGEVGTLNKPAESAEAALKKLREENMKLVHIVRTLELEAAEWQRQAEVERKRFVYLMEAKARLEYESYLANVNRGSFPGSGLAPVNATGPGIGSGKRGGAEGKSKGTGKERVKGSGGKHGSGGQAKRASSGTLEKASTGKSRDGGASNVHNNGDSKTGHLGGNADGSQTTGKRKSGSSFRAPYVVQS